MGVWSLQVESANDVQGRALGVGAEVDQVALQLGGKDHGQLFKSHKGKPGQAKDDDNGGHNADEIGPKHHGGYQKKDQGIQAVNHERQGPLERGFCDRAVCCL